MKLQLNYLLKYIYLFLLTIFLLFFSQKITFAQHPSLLFSSSQKAEIQARIAKGGPVQQAFNAMKVLKTGDDDWARSLAENSFYYAVTGDEVAKNNAVRILSERTTGEKRFSFPKTDEQGKFIDDGGLRWELSMPCNSIVFSYDLLYPALNSSLKNNTKAVMEEWAKNITALFEKPGWYPTGGTYYTGLGSCVGNIGIALKGENTLADSWVNKSKNSFTKIFFNSAHNSGGDYEAGSTYQVYGANPQYIFAAAYERIYNDDFVSKSNVMNIWDFFTYAYMSNEKYSYYGDNSGSKTILLGEYLYILQKHKQKNNPKVAAWLWLWNKVRGTGIAQNDWMHFKHFDYIGIVLWYPQDVTPVNPNEVSEYKNKQSNIFLSNTSKTNVNPGGMATIRNGWTENQNITLWLVNRYRTQIHQHYDPNHFLFSAYGEELLSNYNIAGYENGFRGQLSQQNSILIDDGPKSGMNASLGKFYDFFTSPVGDLLLSDSRYPHADFSTQPKLQIPGVGTAYWDATEEKVDPIVQADRVILFPKQFSIEPYVIMYDRFNKDNNNHTYTWQSYLVPEHGPVSGLNSPEDPVSFQNSEVSLQMFFISSNQFTKKVISAKGDRKEKDLLQITQTGVKEGRFLTILHPSKDSSSTFNVTVLNKENPTVVQIKSGTNENIIIANTTESDQTFEPYISNARLVVIDKKDGVVNKYLVYRGKKVSLNGKALLQSDQPVSLVASWNGNIVKGAGMATANSQTTLSTSNGATKTISLKPIYSQFEETGQSGEEDISTEMINYYYLLMKMKNMSIPETVKVDYNNDGKVDDDDRQIFIRRYKDK